MSGTSDTVSPVAVLGAVSTVSILGVLPVFLFAALFVTIRIDLPLAVSQLGLLTSVFYAVAAISSVPAGFVCERLGPTRALRASALASTCALLGLSTVTTGWLEFVPWLVLGGIGDALSKPASNLGLSSLHRARNLGFIFGIKQSSIPVATMISGAAVPLLALTVGWRPTLAGLGATTLVAFWITARCSGLPVVPRSERGSATRKPLTVAWELPLILLMLGAGLGVAAGATLNAFYVESAVDIGLTPSAAGTSLAVCGALTIVTRLAAGAFIDRRVRHTGFTAVGKMMLAGSSALLLLGFSTAQPVFIAMSVLSFCAAWGWNGMFHFVLVQRYTKAPAMATGVVSLGIFVGATIGPAAFGFLASAGIRTAGWFLLASFMLGSASSLFAVERVLARRAGEVEAAATPLPEDA